MSETPSWNRALTLSERDFLFPKGTVPPGFDRELAQKRLARWVQECQLEGPQLERRLRSQGLDTERFLHLLGSPEPTPSETPAWLAELQRIYATPVPPEAPIDLWRRALEGHQEAVFLEVVLPLLAAGWRQLEEQLAEISDAGGVLEGFAERWVESLPRQFLQMVLRALILELYLCRLQGTLDGATPEARFDSFLDPLRQPEGALQFFSDYPVLGRVVVRRSRQWLACGVELAQRLVADHAKLAEVFGQGQPLGHLARIQPGLGDRHEEGRTVCLVEFSSGTRCIYKPRSLALDVVFQEFLGWLGDVGIEPRLKTLRVLDHGTHGWVEFVDEAPCQDLHGIERFYQRQGVYLALLYALEATDFHHENLIATGEHPVLIDLETLFQPILADAELERERLNPVFTTILRSGLLPRQTGGGEGLDGVEISGLGAHEGQLRPVRVMVGAGTDTMGFADAQEPFPVGQHLPRLDGKPVPFQAHSATTQASFEATYRKLIELRPQLLAPGGWLDRFAGLESRVIVRPTNVYSHLGYRGYHPDYLQDSLHRERFFDRLWIDADLLEWMPSIIPTEHRDLMRGDVPHFRARTDSRDLVADGFLLEDAFPISGLELTRRRLETLDERDLERQLALFRLAVASSRRLDEPAADDMRALRPLPGTEAQSSDAKGSDDDFLKAAVRLGERLDALAFHAQDWVSWFHLAPNPDATQSLQPVSYDLYSGLGGIALFYAQLGKQTGDPRWTALARRALATARHRLDPRTEKVAPRYFGGYGGLGGWIYCLAYLGALWGEPELFDAAEEARDRALPEIASDDGLDLIAGSAGCLASLLALHRHRPSDKTLAVATACGDHLVARAEPQASGLAWHIPSIAELPLTGFAHGTAGIAWALAHLTAQTGEARFAQTARGALAYERSLFSAQQDNWPDLRQDRAQDGEWAYFHAWCHGAPGIGLSRLGLLDVLDDGELEDEVHAAIRSTLAVGFGGSQCLCHGDLGNLELLSRAGEQLGDPTLVAQARHLAGRILAGFDRDGARCGLSSWVEIPGLLTGLAGIGYGFLQQASAEVPSVLTLETPSG